MRHRPIRTCHPGALYHVVQKGAQGFQIFEYEQDYLQYLLLCRRAELTKDIKVETYVLMSNHVHLLIRPFTQNALSAGMQLIAGYYSGYFNRRRGLSGTIWSGRFYSKGIPASMTEQTREYIFLNPVRAGLVEYSWQYRWSTAYERYRHEEVLGKLESQY